jgi:N-acetylglucosamine malate deacetylase 1
VRILAVGAHPDDLEVCCGGTLARFAQRGDEVVMAHATSGDKGTFDLTVEEISAIREAEAREAAAIAGATSMSLQMSDGDVLASDREHRAAVVDLIRGARPDLIITHYPQDYMGDHNELSKLVFDCSFFATLPNLRTDRPYLATVPSIYYMENFGGLGFQPTEFVDISSTIETKVSMMSAHESQVTWIRDHHHADIIEQLRANARVRGYQCGVAYAEGFAPCLQWMRVRTTRLLP